MEPTSPQDNAPPATPLLRRFRFWVVVLVLYGLAMGLPYLGAWPLASHEALAAERSREMIQYGGWLVPHLRGEADVRKPPLQFWVSGALSVVAGGMNEWTARLPSVAASIGTMLLVVFWMRGVAGWRTAVVTGLVFLTSVGTLIWGRRAEVDMPLCFWTTLSMVAYWFGLREPVRRRQVVFFAVMWVSLGLGVLTKGPLPVGLLAVTAIVMAVSCPEGRRIGRMLPLVGPLLLLAVLVPWVVGVVVRHPEALRTWYVESLGRYAGEMGHEKAWHFYIHHAPLLWLPWVLPVGVGLVLAIRRRAVPKPAWLFLLAWGVGGLVFLSLSTGKRLHYALPATPPFIALAGLGVNYLLQLPRPFTKAVRRVLGLHVLLVPGLVGAGLYAAREYPEFKWQMLLVTGTGAAGLAAVFGLYAWGRPWESLAAFAVCTLAVYTLAAGVLIGPMLRATESEAVLGRFIRENTADPEAVVCYRYVESQVLFYAGRQLPMLETPGAVAAWRRDHPGGYVVARQTEGREDLDRLGGWEEVLPGPSAGRLVSRDFVLLKDVAPPADGAAGKGSAAAGKGKPDGR